METIHILRLGLCIDNIIRDEKKRNAKRRDNQSASSDATLAFFPLGFFVGVGLGSLWEARRAETRARVACSKNDVSVSRSTKLWIKTWNG